MSSSSHSDITNTGDGSGCHQQRSDGLDEEDVLLHHQHRKPPQLPIKNPTVQGQQMVAIQSIQQTKHNHSRLPSPPLQPMVSDDEAAAIVAEKDKKQLEWELSSLGADDLRSHAWYHGYQVDRSEAERLLRQCVVDEHGYNIMSDQSVSNDSKVATTATNEGSDSDGLDDVSSMSSDGDFGVEGFLDELIDDNGMVPDPSMATNTTMAAMLLFQQHRRMNGLLPVKPSVRPQNRRRHFYCFLVRDSTNVRPPGRFVVSCLRVDKYDCDDRKLNKTSDKDERRHEQTLYCQRQRRLQRQLKHPVLHFVINEIIQQSGTVYERSQFTFGDTLPLAASITASSISTSGRKYQPAFDSVPDLIRYYVGGAEDDAVLSYGGVNDEMMGNLISQPRHTEVRIRYPCNRRRPLKTTPMISNTVTPTTFSEIIDNIQPRMHHSYTRSKTSHAPDVITSADVSMSPPRLHSWLRSSTPSANDWINSMPLLKPSIRRTPSATVTSATITSATEKCFKPSSADGSTTSSTTLPRTSTSSLKINPRPPTPDLLSTTRPFESLTSRLLKSESSSSTSSNMTLCTSKLSSPIKLLNKDMQPSTSKSLLMSSTSTNHSLHPSTTISLISPTQKEEIAQKPLNILEDPCETQSTILDHDPSVDSGGKSGIIDMDAEIAAAMAGIGDYDTYGEVGGLFNLPELTIIRSSFSKAKVGDESLNKHINKKYENQDTSFDSHQVPCCSKYLDDPSYINNNKSNVKRHHDQRPLSPYNPFSLETPQLGKKVNSLETQQEKAIYQDWKLKLNTQKIKPEEYQSTYKHMTHSYEELKSEFDDEHDIEWSTSQSKKPKWQCQLDQTKYSETSQQATDEEKTIKELTDEEVQMLICESQMKSDQDLKKENSLSTKPIINEDFEIWRTRWAETLLHQLTDENSQEHLDQQQTLPMESSLTTQFPILNTSIPVQSDNYVPNPSVDLQNQLMETNIEDAFVELAQTDSIPSSVGVSTENNSTRKPVITKVETMVGEWLGLCETKDSNSIDNDNNEVMAHKEVQNYQVDLSKQCQQQQPYVPKINSTNDQLLAANNNSLMEESQSGESVWLKGKTAKSCSVDSTRTSTTIKNNENITSTFSSNALMSADNYCASTSALKIANHIEGFGYNESTLFSDYENTNSLKDNSYCNQDKNIGQNSINRDSVNYENINYKDKKQPNSNLDIITSMDVDYENIVVPSIENIDYENINLDNNDKHNIKKRQQLINDSSGGSTVVKSALQAVHLAIIGDPDDSIKETSVAGTGRLAAALCRADGRATVIPYCQNDTGERENEPVVPIIGTCPLQLLDQPGPEGRRARLDVIERFACLQYLVAMTVIVTPCLILIGGDKINPSDNLKWSLEDEYEYRRRRFYNRCAGAGGLCSSGDYSSYEDEYDMTTNSNFNSEYSLPPKEEWAVEKRHWLDCLAKHRAAALDKWIRTAADVKQAVGDVYGYRALMSALCSDRIQALQDAWASLRHIYTATAVAFESQLRPEFMGRRDKHVSTGIDKSTLDSNIEDDNDVDVLLQLPPNITVPDATALAVLYEQLYNNDDNDGSITVTSINDNNRKEENYYRSSALVTSPLSLLPSPWASSNSGISGGLGTSVAADYGLQALHVLCLQYSEWVQHKFSKGDSEMLLTKVPIFQLDRFRNNLQTLLHQYGVNDDNYNNCKTYYKSNDNFRSKKPIKYNRDAEFTYEKYYEDQVEKYNANGGVYDGDDDDDDDDDNATVINCSTNRSISMVSNTPALKSSTDSSVAITMEEHPQKNFLKNHRRHQCCSATRAQEENKYCRWIKEVGVYGIYPAPLDIVFHTELHVHLFWPPTLLLLNDHNSDNHQLIVPAYALGTTYAAKAAAILNGKTIEHSKYEQELHPSTLRHLINTQLDRAVQDMRLRYKAMDTFLDGACAYSMLAARAAIANNMGTVKQQKQYLLSQ